jgi:hypothetical protein
MSLSGPCKGSDRALFIFVCSLFSIEWRFKKLIGIQQLKRGESEKKIVVSMMSKYLNDDVITMTAAGTLLLPDILEILEDISMSL